MDLFISISFNIFLLFIILIMARKIDQQRAELKKYEDREYHFPQTSWFQNFLNNQFRRN